MECILPELDSYLKILYVIHRWTSLLGTVLWGEAFCPNELTRGQLFRSPEDQPSEFVLCWMLRCLGWRRFWVKVLTLSWTNFRIMNGQLLKCVAIFGKRHHSLSCLRLLTLALLIVSVACFPWSKNHFTFVISLLCKQELIWSSRPSRRQTCVMMVICRLEFIPSKLLVPKVEDLFDE